MNNNDLRYLIFLLLLMFLTGMTSGCGNAPTKSRFPDAVCNPKDPNQDFRCHVYMPEPDVEVDGVEELDD